MHGRKRRIVGWVGLAAGAAIVAAWVASGKVTRLERNGWKAGWGLGVQNGIASIRYQTQAAEMLASRSTGLIVAESESWVVNTTWALHAVVPKATREIYEHGAITAPNGRLWIANPLAVVMSSDYTRTVIFPVWLPGVLAGAFGGALLTIGIRKRWRPGMCRRCGYDRSTLPNAAPCPECGRAADQPVAVSRPRQGAV